MAKAPKPLNTKGLQALKKAVLTPPDVVLAPNSRCTGTDAPNPAKRLDRGSIWAADGSVLVDQQRYPTLWRAVQAAGKVIAAVRNKWAAVEDAARHGHQDQADAMRAELLGVAPTSSRPIIVPENLPAEVPDLVDALKKAPDKKAAGKIRAKLRELGVRGGLRALRGLPLILITLRFLLEG